MTDELKMKHERHQLLRCIGKDVGRIGRGVKVFEKHMNKFIKISMVLENGEVGNEDNAEHAERNT